MRSSPSLSTTSALALLALAAGCNVYDPAFLNRDGGVDGGDPNTDGGGGMDADVDGGMDAGDTDVDGGADAGDASMDAGDGGIVVCEDLKHPPAAPEGEPSGDRTLIFALRDPILDQQMPGARHWSSVGYDLDGLCTSGLGSHPCVPPSGDAPPVDGARGVDNVMGSAIWPAIIAVDSNFEFRIDDRMRRGEGLLVRIQGWNGMDDDPEVTVTLASTVMDDDGITPPPTPRWDGTDTFLPMYEMFHDVEGDQPIFLDTEAYVRDRVVVARLPVGELALPWGRREAQWWLRLAGAHLVGRIRADEQRLENVVLFGRYDPYDLYTTLDEFGTFDTDRTLCGGTRERRDLEDLIASMMDIRLDPTASDPDATCDALSFALGFTGYRGQWGPLWSNIIFGAPTCRDTPFP